MWDTWHHLRLPALCAHPAHQLALKSSEVRSDRGDLARRGSWGKEAAEEKFARGRSPDLTKAVGAQEKPPTGDALTL